jgi:hypothetical protein
MLTVLGHSGPKDEQPSRPANSPFPLAARTGQGKVGEGARRRGSPTDEGVKP